MRASLLDIFKQAYIISTTANEDVGECFNFMEPKETQNVISDPILMTTEEREGNDLGRGETGSSATFATAPRTEKPSVEVPTDLERMQVSTPSSPRSTAFA